MNSFKGLMTNFFNKLSEFGKNSSFTCKPCGNPMLDALLKKIDENNKNTHILLIKNKNTQINEFIVDFRKEAEHYGKVLFNTFADYPDESKKQQMYDAFEDIHILRFDEFNLGMAGWLPAYSLEITSFVSNVIFPILHQACAMLAEEKGDNSHSIDVWEGYAIMCYWLRECTEILDNIPKFFDSKIPQKVYYKGKIKRVSLCFLYFLSRIGCSVIIDPNSNIELDNILQYMPKYMNIEIME